MFQGNTWVQRLHTMSERVGGVLIVGLEDDVANDPKLLNPVRRKLRDGPSRPLVWGAAQHFTAWGCRCFRTQSVATWSSPCLRLKA